MAALVAVAVSLSLTWLGSASATAETFQPRGPLSADAQQRLVDQFVGRVHNRWKLDIKAGDYEARADGSSILITPKGSPLVRHVQVHGVDMVAVGATVHRPSTVGVHPYDNPSWNEPVCYARVNVYSKITPNVVDAWADACYQTGTVAYANQTGWDAVLKQWQTCATTGADGLNYNLTGCNIAFAPPPDNGGFNPLSWDDWDPKGTITQSPCGTVNLSVSIGGVGASLGLNLCDTLNPVKGTEPLDFQANWQGRAPTGQSRETGDIIGVNDVLDSSFNFQVFYGGIGASL
jgi:hypothetical protein